MSLDDNDLGIMRKWYKSPGINLYRYLIVSAIFDLNFFLGQGAGGINLKYLLLQKRLMGLGRGPNIPLNSVHYVIYSLYFSDYWGV